MVKLELDEITKERWIKQMQDDYPQVDRLMCEIVIGKWCEDQDYFDKIESGEIQIPEPVSRNQEYVYKGVTFDEKV